MTKIVIVPTPASHVHPGHRILGGDNVTRTVRRVITTASAVGFAYYGGDEAMYRPGELVQLVAEIVKV